MFIVFFKSYLRLMKEEEHVEWKRKEVLSFNEMERGKMVISIVNGK